MKRLIAPIALVPLLLGSAFPMPALAGRLASELGDHHRAVALLANRNDPQSQVWLAHSQYHLGNNAQAIRTWRKALSDSKHAAAAQDGLEHLKGRLQELIGLLDRYQDLLEREPSQDDWKALSSQLAAYISQEPDSQNALRARVVYADVLERLHEDSTPVLNEIRGGILGDWALLRRAAKGEAGIVEKLVSSKSPLAPAAMLATKDPEWLKKLSRMNVPEAEEALFLTQDYRGYYQRYPKGRHILEVLQALSKETLTSQERLEYGIALYRQRDYGKAIRLLKGIPEGRYFYGRSLWQAGQLGDAAQVIRGLMSDPQYRTRALITLGQILEDLKAPGAEDCYKKASAASGELGLDGLSLWARYLRRQDKDPSRVEQMIMSRYPGSTEAADSRWWQFWRSYQAGSPKLAPLQALVEQHNVRAAYWLGKLSDPKYYRLAVQWDPHSFYGYRAQQVLNGISNPFDTGGYQDPKPIRPSWEKLFTAEEASLLSPKGIPMEVSEVARELLLVKQYRELSSLAGKAEGWVKALRGDYTGAIASGDHRTLQYPLGYLAFNLEACKDRNLNPLLLAALVREESRYDPNACSWVGAMGLAQLMPSTAKSIDPKIGELGNRPLTDPRANLWRGAYFLSYGHNSFPAGQDYLMVASYNAGIGAVTGWMKRFPTSDPDVFIESIPYKETRYYVRKVFESYWNYRDLYGN